MSTLTLFFALLANPTALIDPLVDIAVENCKNVPTSRVEEAKIIARKIYLVEQLFDVPPDLKGMVLAAACSESGFNPSALGDRKFSRNKRTPKAVGVLQLWPWWEHGRWGYQINRRDPEQSALAWMTHIARQLPSVKRRCRPRTKKLLWIQAWVHAIRAPKSGGRCREKPKHLRYLRKFHKIYDRGNPTSITPKM